MATCKDCLHYPVCNACGRVWLEWIIDGTTALCTWVQDKFPQYTDKTKYVEREPGKWQKWYPPMHIVMTGEEVLYRCSVCSANYSDVEGYGFCPHCGAMMEKETDNGDV